MLFRSISSGWITAAILFPFITDEVEQHVIRRYDRKFFIKPAAKHGAGDIVVNMYNLVLYRNINTDRYNGITLIFCHNLVCHIVQSYIKTVFFLIRYSSVYSSPSSLLQMNRSKSAGAGKTNSPPSVGSPRTPKNECTSQASSLWPAHNISSRARRSMTSLALLSLFSKLFTANGLPIKSSAPASRAFSSASGSGSEETMTGILSRSLSLFSYSASSFSNSWHGIGFAK